MISMMNDFKFENVMTKLSGWLYQCINTNTNLKAVPGTFSNEQISTHAQSGNAFQFFA
jgi:hypothetical protein